MSYQTTIILGNLGKEPETRFTQSGTSVCSFSVGTNRKYTDGSGQVVKETCWFRVSVFGKQGEACQQYLHKGSEVLVEGRLSPDTSTGGPKVFTRNDGTAGATYEIVASTVRFGNSGGQQQQAQQAQAPQAEPEPEF